MDPSNAGYILFARIQMALSAGTRLGPYELVAPIGAGGMGEVYRARDTRLDRTVAVKVLPEHLSSSAESRQRFEREAKTISQLSHPHICALYDVGHQDGVDYLVMEYLEGETLAARLAKGPLPIDLVLRHGTEIADALDKAHRQGIVHRDLKPGNVMITKSGVKLLDFGLAKALVSPSTSTDLTALPTAAAVTREGSLLGTVQYMAPEQLEGKEADARTDIFAFGCVLYEMATGKKAFWGKSQASLISAIMGSQPPPISATSPMTPPAFDRVVRTCLAKDPDDRWQTAGDAMLALQWGAEGELAAAPRPLAAAKRTSRERLAWTIASLVSIAFAVLLISMARSRDTVSQRAVRRLSLLPPEGTTFTPGNLAVAPDGRRLAFVALNEEGKRQLCVRPLDSLAAQVLHGTEGATAPFWSPDGRFLGFFADRKLKRIEATGGPPQTICEALNGRGGTWNRDGTIVFSPSPLTGIYRVPATGGQPEALTALDASREENSHRWPDFLPDGRQFTFFARSRQRQNHAIYIGSIDSRKTIKLIEAESNAVYVRPGYLLFLREGTLLAHPFDAKALRVTGEPFRIAETVRVADPTSPASFTATQGVLAYGGGSATIHHLVWYDRKGKRLEPAGPSGHYLDFRLSRDEQRVAIDLLDPSVGGRQIWVLDLSRGVSSRITSETWEQFAPVWSPDAGRVAFSSNRTGHTSLAERSASGVGPEESLLESTTFDIPTDWSPDGRFILYEKGDLPTTAVPNLDRDAASLRMLAAVRTSLWVLPMFGDRKPFPVLETPFSLAQGSFSPDGRRIAYVSTESGRPEVYVETFPAPSGKVRISTDGGTEPLWRSDGRELFYVAPDNRLMAVSVQVDGARLLAGRPEPLLRVPPDQHGGAVRHHYAVSGDGQRFLLAPLAPESVSPTITVVLDWQSELEKK